MTGGYEVLDIAEMEYEIRNKTGASFHVNLSTRTCSCFEFQMLAIPCSHAIAAALKAKLSVNDLVIDPYKLDALKRAYEGTIVPETGSTGGIQIPSIITDLNLTPPATRRPPGRPKKSRYFSRGEKRVSLTIYLSSPHMYRRSEYTPMTSTFEYANRLNVSAGGSHAAGARALDTTKPLARTQYR